jgi:hypothetical protein
MVYEIRDPTPSSRMFRGRHRAQRLCKSVGVRSRANGKPARIHRLAMDLHRREVHAFYILFAMGTGSMLYRKE